MIFLIGGSIKSIPWIKTRAQREASCKRLCTSQRGWFSRGVLHLVKMTILRTFLTLIVPLDLELYKMDVKTGFLHGGIEEELCMKIRYGFATPDKKQSVCKLKSLYWL